MQKSLVGACEMQKTISPKAVSGSILIPPSKSVAHRALICAALADGQSRLSHLGDSDDMKATIGALSSLGASFERDGDTLTVTGTGGVPKREQCTADCIESGSTLRFLIPVFSLCGGDVTLTGRGRLLERPQTVYETLFSSQGRSFFVDASGVHLYGAVKSGEITVDGSVSSQFITGLLFTLPLCDGDSVIRITPPFESASYVQITCDVLSRFGIVIEQVDAYTFRIPGNQRYRPCDMAVEGDYSQMAFFGVLGALCGEVRCKGLSPDSLQGDRVICEVLERFGAQVDRSSDCVCVRRAPLTGQVVDLADCPDLGPILMVLASFADGVTHFLHAGRLRLKESDRIAAMEAELSKLGVNMSSDADSVTITSRRPMTAPCIVEAHNDHRIAMSLAIFARAAEYPVTIMGAECVNKSYPNFFEDLSFVK